jgi:hypothetical protein
MIIIFSDNNYYMNFKVNGVYVVIEILNDVSFSANCCKVIGVYRDYELAMKFTSPNRYIKGPIPIYDDNFRTFKPRTLDPLITKFNLNPDDDLMDIC